MNEQLKIEFAEVADLKIIVELCKKHSEFEKSEYHSNGKAKKLEVALFSNPPKLFCLLAKIDDEIVGFATYMKQFATWDAEDYIYMDCLYLIDSARNKSIGEQLIWKIQKEAIKLNCKLIQWQTPTFNRRASKFYKRIGAYSKSKERFFLDVS